MTEQSRIAPAKAVTHKLQGYRYYDRDFAAREWEAVWAKSWLLICRQDAVPEEGDFIVEEVGPESILVVRQEDGGIKSF